MNDALSNLPESDPTSQHDATRLSDGAHSTSWFYGQSDRGRVRENNEDQFSLNPERNLFIVADGMGGHAAGEVASLIAVETLQQWLTPGAMEGMDSAPLDAVIAGALRGANTAVINASETRPEWNGMGSTAVMALLHGGTLHIANVGDSRAYLFRSGVMQMLSQDHSVAAILAEQNQLSREEVRTHPLRNRLTVCLGIQARIQPYTNRFLLQTGDRVLLCSDGLWDMLPDEEIAQLWGEHAEAKDAVQALIAAANKAGGQDNITAVVLHIEEHNVFSIATNHGVENSGSSSLDDTVVVIQ